MTSPRTPGKRGRLPARTGDAKFAIGYLADYLREPLPAPAYPVDVTGGVEDWGMAGNGPDPTCTTHPDGVGDCTFAGRQHLKMAKAAAAGEAEKWETSNALVAEYLAYDHGQDEGAVIADLLLYWYRKGLILGFAPVDHTDPAQVDAAMQAFHGTYCGVELTADADRLFSEGRPWGSGSTHPDPREGHCIVKVQADGAHQDGWVTWGAVQPSTLTWTMHCLTEAWAVITTEDQAAKLDMAALIADIEALGGQQDVPAPKPAPVVFPAAAARTWINEPHAGGDLTFSNKLRAWMTQAGYPTS